MSMFGRMFGKPKQEANAVATLDKLNESKDVTVTKEQAGPLGLSLNKAPSVLRYIGKKLSADEKQKKRNDELTIERVKISTLSVSMLKIGSWEKISRHEGELVARFFYKRKKLVWEVFDGTGRKNIEIKWSEVSAIRADIGENRPEVLKIELNSPPQFHRIINPNPRTHIPWGQAQDFTAGKATISRHHTVVFPEGTLDVHYRKLLQFDQMYELSQKPFLYTEMDVESHDHLESDSIRSFSKSNYDSLHLNPTVPPDIHQLSVQKVPSEFGIPNLEPLMTDGEANMSSIDNQMQVLPSKATITRVNITTCSDYCPPDNLTRESARTIQTSNFQHVDHTNQKMEERVRVVSLNNSQPNSFDSCHNYIPASYLGDAEIEPSLITNNLMGENLQDVVLNAGQQYFAYHLQDYIPSPWLGLELERTNQDMEVQPNEVLRQIIGETSQAARLDMTQVWRTKQGMTHPGQIRNQIMDGNSRVLRSKARQANYVDHYQDFLPVGCLGEETGRVIRGVGIQPGQAKNQRFVGKSQVATLNGTNGSYVHPSQKNISSSHCGNDFRRQTEGVGIQPSELTNSVHCDTKDVNHYEKDLEDIKYRQSSSEPSEKVLFDSQPCKGEEIKCQQLSFEQSTTEDIAAPDAS